MADKPVDGCQISRWQQLKQRLNNLDPATFRKALREDVSGVLIDCRREQEFASGHLPGASNLDYLSYDFLDKLEGLDTASTYYVYCRTGRRSIRTCTLMQNGGFQRVFNLDGGLTAWEEQLGALQLDIPPG